MKNTIITLIIATIFTGCNIFANAQNTSAQNTENQILVGITGGATIPLGNFTRTDFSNPNSGFAGSGGNIGAMGTYMLNKHWGITALASYHSYSFKGLQVLADSFKESFALDSTTVNVKGSNYSVNLLAGPYYSAAVNKKIHIDSRLLVGFINAHLAGNTVLFEDQAASTFTQNSASANTFGFQFGTGVRYDIWKHFGVMLNVDYFYSKPDFQITYENRNNSAGRWIKNYDQPITGINTNLTIVYQLTKS